MYKEGFVWGRGGANKPRSWYRWSKLSAVYFDQVSLVKHLLPNLDNLQVQKNCLSLSVRTCQMFIHLARED